MNEVVAGALLSLITAQAAQQRSFAEILASYRSGQYAIAVAEVKSRTDLGYSDDAERWLDRQHRAKVPLDLEAALLLYTEVTFSVSDALLAGEAGATDARVSHYARRVKRLQQVLAERDRQSSFLRNWYLLWGAYLHARQATNVDSSVDFLAMAVQAFPDDPEILLMLGTSKEASWWSRPDNPQRHPEGKPGGAERALREARDYFRKSVATGAGSLDESHLRLGRTSIALEEYEVAASQLERVQSLPGNPVLSYLANLFLGDLHERRGNLAAAAAAYDAARRLVPSAQSARIAASQLAYREGTRKRAAEVVTQTLSAPSSQMDPWWWYIRGQAWQLEPRLNAARRAVKP